MEHINRHLSAFGDMMLASCKRNGFSPELTETVIQGVERVEAKLPSLHDTNEKYEVVMLFVQRELAMERSSNDKKALEDFMDIIKKQDALFQRSDNLIEQQEKHIQELQMLLRAKNTISEN